MRLAVNFPAFVNDMLSIVHNNFEQIVLAVIASFIAGLLLFMLGIPTKLLQRHFAKKDQKEQQNQEIEQKKKDAKKLFKRCLGGVTK
jgi:putative Mn2+ efflux pump MntP